MTTRIRNEFGSHDPQQHLRYVEVYSISAATTAITGATDASPIAVTSASHGFSTGDQVFIEDVEGNTAANGTWTVTVTGTNTFTLDDSTGDGTYTSGGTVGYAQPIRVKLLAWDPADSRYEVSGTDFPVGNRADADKLDEEDQIWISWRRDALRWEVIGGGIGEHFQIVRGQTTGAVSPSDLAFQITIEAAYEQHSANPGSPLWVKVPTGGVTLSSGAFIWAIWRENVLTFDPGGGSVQVDWLMFDLPEGTTVYQVQRFELTANKALTSATATGKLLDHAGTKVGSDITFHDPRQKFAGKIANYVGSETGFRGIAFLRQDLAASEPNEPAWYIAALERFAEWAIVSWDSSGENWTLVADAFGGDEWNWRRPAVNGAVLAVTDPASLIGRTPANTEKALARLTNDADTPTYQIDGVRNEDRRIAISTGDTVPLELLSKVVNGGVYNSETDLIAKVAEVEEGGLKKLRIAYTPGTGGGGGGPSTEKRLISGLTYARVLPSDDTFEVVNLTRVAGGIIVAAPAVVFNLQGRAYNPDTGIIAAFDDDEQIWLDISPVAGQKIPLVVRQTIEPAVWNKVGKTLTPSTFEGIWLQRDGITHAGAALAVGGAPISIICENQSLERFNVGGSDKGVIAWVFLQQATGVYVLDGVDCSEFVY